MLKVPGLPLPGVSGCLQCNKSMSGRAVSRLRLKEVMHSDESQMYRER